MLPRCTDPANTLSLFGPSPERGHRLPQDLQRLSKGVLSAIIWLSRVPGKNALKQPSCPEFVPTL